MMIALNMPPSLITILVFILTSISLLPPPTSGGVTKIPYEFKKKIDSAPEGSTWNVMVLFKHDESVFDAIYSAVANLTVPEGQENLRAYQLTLRLDKYAEETQRKVISGVKAFQKNHPRGKHVTYEMLSVSNDLGIWKAPKDLLYLLGEDETPEFSNITRIVEDVGFPKGKTDPDDMSAPLRAAEGAAASSGKGQDPFKPMEETWGIERIGARAWWEKEFNGSGVIIGHIDDGVDCRHPSLKWNWVGLGEGWYDPVEKTNTFPFEEDKVKSHGTHTLGIAVGRGRKKPNVAAGKSIKDLTEDDIEYFGIGVAPGARWSSCIACDEFICYANQLLACARFYACNDFNRQCLYKPDIISISSGIPQNLTYSSKTEGTPSPYTPLVRYLVGAGIIPVFSAGNNGHQGCTTISEPEHEETINVGNTDTTEFLRFSSSMGPPLHRYSQEYIDNKTIVKPDFVAPGTQIWSAVYAGRPAEFKFEYRTGTSQAAPHMAGAIALLLSRTKGLTFHQIYDILKVNVLPNTKLKSAYQRMRCGEYYDEDTPNQKFGWGRLQLPHPDSLFPIEVKPPTRKMPPPPDYSTLADNATPPSVRAGMVGVVIMMAGILFLMMNAARMEI